MSERSHDARLLRRLFPTRNAGVDEILAHVEKALSHNVNILIRGESGTGKDTLAHAIHLAGPRRDRPFVKIDCSSLPADIFESELFGYEKGAFTGAFARKSGKLETAHRGVVYFDEIGTLTSPLQAKLLRIIQERSFTRLGGTRSVEIDVRLIASSNAGLESLIAAGEFRKDLYYRLNVLSVDLPPLRERPEDIAPLARSFLKEAAGRFAKRFAGFDAAALELLQTYNWPGNIRELRNVIDRAAILEETDRIRASSLPLEEFVRGDDFIATAARHLWSMEELERRYIVEILRQTDGNFTRAAEILGLNRKTLLEKRRRYGID